ncbi:MAG TPA: hypothetical protein VEA80_15485 [Vitreimonas sp.]|nr:hypothetical protein [Vitreimonas sp.]HYD88876.1 hypothetical protein [Vitreimonas sp.]
MDGRLEHANRHGANQWRAAIDLIDFLESVLGFCNEVSLGGERAGEG